MSAHTDPRISQVSINARSGYRIGAIIEKEWAEIRKNKMILWMMALLPVLLVGMVLGTDYFMLLAAESGQDMDEDEMPIPEELQHTTHRGIHHPDERAVHVLLAPDPDDPAGLHRRPQHHW